jgi:hypothetical protein
LDDPQPTGVFFPDQSAAAIIQAVNQFEENETRISPSACRANAERFRTERFHAQFSAFVESHWESFCQNRAHASLI